MLYKSTFTFPYLTLICWSVWIFENLKEIFFSKNDDVYCEWINQKSLSSAWSHFLWTKKPDKLYFVAEVTCWSHSELVIMTTKSQSCNTSSLPLSQPVKAPKDDKPVGKEVFLCRICEKSGDVLQCNGPCLGMYHTACTGHTSHEGSYFCEECCTGTPDFITFSQLSCFGCDWSFYIFVSETGQLFWRVYRLSCEL